MADGLQIVLPVSPELMEDEETYRAYIDRMLRDYDPAVHDPTVPLPQGGRQD